MKTKKSKRLLAAFLAAIMVLSTFAAMPFSSFASTYSADDLYTLLQQYKERVSNCTGTSIYTNLQNSYIAWEQGYRTYICTAAGAELGDLPDIDTAYTNLKTEMDKMTVWTPFKSTYNQIDSGKTTANLTGGDEFNNVLYYGGIQGMPFQEINGKGDGVCVSGNTWVTAGVRYGKAVLLYDGTAPSFVISTRTRKSSSNWISSNERVRSVSVNTQPFEFRHNWHGNSSADDPGYVTESTSFMEYRPDVAGTPSQKKDKYWYSNTLYWAGNEETFGSDSIKQYDGLTFQVYSDSDSNQANRTDTIDTSKNTDKENIPTIYVLNYKGILSQLEKIPFETLLTYSSSIVRGTLANIDLATNLNPQAAITGVNITNEVSTLSASIANITNSLKGNITGFGSATTYDIDEYVNAAKLLNTYSAVYQAGNDDGKYTKSSWSRFVQVYQNAQQLFDNKSVGAVQLSATVLGNDGKRVADNLRSIKLVSTTQLIDDTALKKYLSDYDLLTESYYTADTWKALSDAVTEALKLYTDGNYALGITLEKNEENQAIYDAALASVKSAWEGLRISSDTKVFVHGGYNSYKDMVTYTSAFDSAMYKDYTSAADVLATTTAFVNTLPNLTFTTEADIIGQYTAQLKATYYAFDNLQLNGFASIKNGTIVNKTTGNTGGVDKNNVHSYLNGQITSITYFKTVSGSTSFSTEYDLSVRNDYYNWAANRPIQWFVLGFGDYGQDTAPAYDYGVMSVKWRDGGIAMNNVDSTYTYHSLLMRAKQDKYEMDKNSLKLAKSSEGVIYGTTTVQVNDLGGIKSAQFVTPDLAEGWQAYTGIGSNFETFNRMNSDVKQTVTVLDISDLYETLARADVVATAAQSNKFNCYTPKSWAAYAAAYSAAKADLDYATMSNDQILAECQARKDNLDNAINGLTFNTEEGSHNYIVQADNLEATCTTAGRDHRICSVCGNEINVEVQALGHLIHNDSNKDGATHHRYCERGDVDEIVNCTDANGDSKCDVCGQLIYNQADWEQFNSAKSELEAALADAANGNVKYSAAALNALNTAISAIDFYNYTAEKQKSVPDSQQSLINTQATAIANALAAFKKGVADSSVYDANVSKVAGLNADAYNVEAVRAAVSGISVTTQVNVNGKEYAGYDFDQYNTALGTALTENTIPYKVKVIDFEGTEHYLVKSASGEFSYTDVETEATGFAYGDLVTAPNPNSTNADELCAWASKEQPKSITDAAFREMPSKYQTTYNSYTFNVQGYTELTTTSTATNSTDNVKLTFVLAYDGVETGKILDIQYVTAGQTITVANVANAPENIPFYELDTFLDSSTGKALNRRVKFNENTKILVNYTPLEKADYTINFVDEAGSPIDTKTANFNELVTLKANGATAYVNADNGKVLCFGSEYSFYACRNLTVKAVKSTNVKASVDVISTPVLDGSGKVYLVGSFALPQGATIKNFGFVMDGNAATATATNLTLADVDQANQIFNLTASKYTNYGQNGNQFTISFNANAGYPSANYVAYAIYTDANGNECYAYSNVIANAAIA